MDIDRNTYKSAERIFKSRHGNLNELGLPKTARRKLLRYGKVPGTITDANEISELLNISFAYKNILSEVIKPMNHKRRKSKNTVLS